MGHLIRNDAGELGMTRARLEVPPLPSRLSRFSRVFAYRTPLSCV